MVTETSAFNVSLLPGGVLPAALAYRALIDAFGTAAVCVPKASGDLRRRRAPN